MALSENPESGSVTEAYEASETPDGPARRGRVRARRAAVMAVPATLVAGTLAVLTASGRPLD